MSVLLRGCITFKKADALTSIPASFDDNAFATSSASLTGMLPAASNLFVAASQLSAYEASSDNGSGACVKA